MAKVAAQDAVDAVTELAEEMHEYLDAMVDHSEYDLGRLEAYGLVLRALRGE